MINFIKIYKLDSSNAFEELVLIFKIKNYYDFSRMTIKKKF